MESDFIIPKHTIIMSELTDFCEIPSKGFNRLFKVKRYGQWFVLKTLKEEYAADSTYQQLIKKEFEIGILLNHPNVVRYIGFEQDSPYGAGILMEYIDGKTLREYIDEKNIHEKKNNNKICHELLNGLNYLHKLQLTHCDLKPQNIIITHNGLNVKIIDFGLSDIDYYAVFKQTTGSIGYSSPEQISENTTIDCRSDIFSLGKILLEIYPNKRTTINRIARRCTNTRPDKRFSNIDEIFSAINKAKQLKWVLIVLCSLVVLSTIIIITVNQINKSHIKEKEVLIEDYTQKVESLQSELDSANIQNIELMRVEEEKKYFRDTIDMLFQQKFDYLHKILDANPNCIYEDIFAKYLEVTTFILNPDLAESIESQTNDEDMRLYISSYFSYNCRIYNLKLSKRMDKLPRLSELFDKGVISQEEFDKKKQEYNGIYF